jgi:hypothetical protein
MVVLPERGLDGIAPGRTYFSRGEERTGHQLGDLLGVGGEGPEGTWGRAGEMGVLHWLYPLSRGRGGVPALLRPVFNRSPSAWHLSVHIIHSYFHFLFKFYFFVYSWKRIVLSPLQDLTMCLWSLCYCVLFVNTKCSENSTRMPSKPNIRQRYVYIIKATPDWLT